MVPESGIFRFTGYPDILLNFPVSFHANAGIAP
jgi:hypothetical protein